jgi:methyl-accepting chemotaxis protein
MTGRVRRAAAGDLTTEIHRDNASQLGDIQEALGKMIASFHATVMRIDQAAVELSDSASEMNGISNEAGDAIGDVSRSVSAISAGAGSQVELIGDTSHEVGEIEQAILEAAAHAEQASDAGSDALQLTDEGVERAAEIELAMAAVRDTALTTTNSIRSLGEKSTRIDLIVRSIADIAEQTNLLALNAAIEAARAGEQGRGFAVVADEVRRLAEDAQDSTGEIATLTESIRTQTAEAVAAVESGTQTIERGSDAVSLNRDAFAEIREAVARLNESTVRITAIARDISDEAARVRMEIEDVASVAEESSASTEQVSAATQQSAASAQEVTASSEDVARTASALAGYAAGFTLKTGGGEKIVPLRATPERVGEQAQAQAEKVA